MMDRQDNLGYLEGAWLEGLLTLRNNFLIIVYFSLDELSLGRSYAVEESLCTISLFQIPK